MQNFTAADIFSSAYIAGELTNMAPKTTVTSESTSMTTIRRSKSTDKTKTLLPIDFQPSEYSVICGNKRAFFNSTGNRRFRVICQMHVPEFMNAPTKHEKSFVVTKVMKMLRDACPVGAFVAFEKGRWWEVSDRTSREKVGTFFRDCLSDTYKSSSKNKIAERRKKRVECGPSSETMLQMSPSAHQRALVTPTTPAISAPVLPSIPFSRTVAASVAALNKAMVYTNGSTIPPLPAHIDLGSLNVMRPLAPVEKSVLSSSSAPAEDDTSIGSSNGSFYDVDDLTPITL